MTQEEFIEKAREAHGDKYDYSKVEYINSRTKVCIICPEHGEFYKDYTHFIGRKQGCPECSGRKRYSTEEFIEKCKKLEHTSEMSFENTSYVNNKTKIKVFCHHKDENGIEHGEFKITPAHLLSGEGCPKCRYIKSAAGRRRNINDVLNKAKEVHEGKYDYSLITEYKNDRIKYPIICPIHGIFYQTLGNHIKSRQGCPICGRIKCDETRTMPQEEFIEKANKVHNNKYDYSKVEYKKTDIKVCIICPEHGEFWQQPNNHLFGQGCPKCYKDKSKIERELFDFIKETLTEDTIVEENNRIILEGKEIDVYVPSKNIGFEMNGLIWHSDKFNIKEDYHLNKTLKCSEKGVHLIHIFEDEWLNKKKICKDLIKKSLGIVENNINLKLTEIKEINDDNIIFNFLEENDLKGYIKTDINIGLYLNNELIELISFKKIYNSDYEIVRHCYKLGKYKEDKTILIQYFIKKYNPDSIIALVDISKEKDFKYKDLDFFFEKEIKPDYYFVNAKKRFNKEDDIENEEVCKIYDCGYFQYKWTK